MKAVMLLNLMKFHFNLEHVILWYLYGSANGCKDYKLPNEI